MCLAKGIFLREGVEKQMENIFFEREKKATNCPSWIEMLGLCVLYAAAGQTLQTTTKLGPATLMLKAWKCQ